MPATLRMQRLIALLLAVFTAVSLSVTIAPDADAASKRKVKHGIGIARNQIGDQYSYGSDGPRRFDCSGLIYYAYRKAGIRMPRTSDQQADRGRRVKKSNMRRGDLMVFHDGGDVYHIGIFTGRTKDGKRRILHAPSTGKRVHARGVWTNQWYAVTVRNR